MKKCFFIGIDGGGSKTKIRLEDSNGRVIAEALAGPANIRLSFETAYNSVFEGLQSVLQKVRLSKEDHPYLHVGMGLAGFEVMSAREQFLKKLANLNLGSVKVRSDAHTALIGAHGQKKGAIVIVGTGVVGYKLLQAQKIQVGGYGFPHGDEGGAAWLGLEAVRRVFYMLDGRGVSSPLLKKIMKKFDGEVDKLTEWACYANATLFAELSKEVTHYYKKKDPIAQEMIMIAKQHIEKIFAAIENKNPHENGKEVFCILGGLSDFFFPILKASLRKKIVNPLGDACHGALLMIKENYNQKNRF